MKTSQRKYVKLAAIAAAALASVAGIGHVQAQTATFVYTFDTDISANDGVAGGNAPTTTVWSPTNSTLNGAPSASGSEYITMPFNSTAGGWQEGQLNFTGNQNLANYQSISFDIKVDVAHSTAGPNGAYGSIYPVVQNWNGGSPGWGQLSGQTVTNNGTGWQHMTYQLIGVASSWTRLVMDFNNGGGTIGAGPISYWIDNITLNSVPLPAPTINTPIPAPKQHGLTLLPATTGQYQRVMVYPKTASPQYNWYGQASGGNPVSYSFTITNFPSYGNYNAQMFFIPIASMQYNQSDTSVDWNCTNDVVFSIGAESNSIAGGTQATNWTVRFATKTNSPGALGNGNPNLTITNWTVQQLPLGTWTITFNNNTDFTITSPNGSVVAASLPADVANLVSGNYAGNTQMAPYFGVQPNNPGGCGLPTVMSNMKISGTASPAINDNFTTALTNNWLILSDEPSDIFINNGDLIYTLTWNTPNDGGYSTLLAAPTAAGPWNDLVSSGNWTLLNGNKSAQVTSSGLQAATGQTKNGLFKLIKRVPYQLQVLLPGMTNAPGTLSGYTGSPTAQSLSVNLGVVPVTVNMCDSTWHIVNSGDAVTITTTDGSGTTISTSLSNGTVTTSTFAFGSSNASPGWTVTATDTDTPTILPSTSPNVIVNP
jgi:hypothetical protein